MSTEQRQSEPTPPKRRFFRYSLRTLLLSVTLFAILCAMFGARMVREGRERLATAEIIRLGGRFDYRHVSAIEQDGWFSRSISFLFYEDYGRVTGVSLDQTGIVAGDLAVLTSLTRLEGLDISNTEITDAVVPVLAAIPRLKYVNIHNTRLTESGIRELKERRPYLMVDWK